jgi:hypothetical protein
MPSRRIASSTSNRTTFQKDDRRLPRGSAGRYVGRANSLQVCTASHVPMQTWFGYPPKDVSPVVASRSR